MNGTRIVFFGSSEYSLYPLSRLYRKRYRILGVVSSVDKPVGRKQKITPSAVKLWAKKHGIKTAGFEKRKDLQLKFEDFLGARKADFFVVCCYGLIIPKKILDIPKYGSLNIHPSLLPKYRGSSPVQKAIINGDKKTGVSIILMDEKMDHGPILGRKEERIRKDDQADELYKRLFLKGADLLIEVIEGVKKGKITPLPQDEKRATYTKILKREDGKINWDWDDEKKERFIRAMSPWPGAWTRVKLKRKGRREIKRLKILKAHLEKGKLVLDKVQLEGKNPVAGKQFWEGYKKAKIVN